MPINEALFWVGITVFGTGLYFVIDKASAQFRWLAGFVTLAGVAATLYAMYVHEHPEAPTPPLWIYLLVLTWILVGVDIYSRRHTNVAPPTHYEDVKQPERRLPASVISDRQVVALSVEQLIALFTRGETTVDGQRLVKPYLGKWLSVTGEVADVRESAITFKGRSFTRSNGVNTHFDKENRDSLSVLRPGSLVTVIGKIASVTQIEISLDECELVG